MMKPTDEQKHTLVQFIKYGLIGCMNTCITLIAFYVCNTLLHIPHTVANPIGYVLGLVNSFLFNRKWVFQSSGQFQRDAIRFFIGFAICYAIQYAAFTAFMFIFSGVEISWLPMKKPAENISMVLAMVIYTITNFIYNKFVAFKD